MMSYQIFLNNAALADEDGALELVARHGCGFRRTAVRTVTRDRRWRFREAARANRAAQGIGIILASVLTMGFADALVKLVSADLTIWQIFAARSLVAIPIMVALLFATGVSIRPRAPVWAFLRSGLLVLTWLAFYASLPVLSRSPLQRLPPIPARS